MDTGATRTIIKPTTINKRQRLLSTKLRLRTATGESANIHGEVQVEFGIGTETFTHTVIVADIEEDVILGMDVMNAHGFQLDFKNKVIKIGAEEVFLHPYEHSTVPAAVQEDTVIPGRSETIIVARLEGTVKEGTPVMMEPWNHDEEVGRGILIGKGLVTSAKEIPVRLINVNDHPITIKKETKIGTCVPVTSIIRQTSTSDKANVKFEQMMAVAGQSRKPLERKRIKEFLRQYRDLFIPKGGKTGRTSVVKHKIDTGDAKPIRQTARRLPQAKREEAEKIVQEMEEDKVIEPSTSPWVSPVVLVRKKDGTTRFCVDYRQLNNVTKKDSYPLPRIDDTLDTLAESKLFSTLDLKSGYWQVEMDPADKEKTAFTTGSGLWQFNVMPFGLCNAPATFERLMENVLRGLSWKTCLVYLDDIIVLGKTFDEHLKNLEEVFKRLQAAQLMLNPKKCQLFQNKVNYLGHIVSKEGVAVDEEKVASIKQWPQPTDKHQIRSFLGLCTYYRRFIRKFADIAKPLTRLTEEAREFHWDKDCQTAFETLKEHLTTAPILGYPLPEGEFILDTDASNVGIGGVLSQIQGGQERVLSYFSKVLSKPERNYCVTRRELLAVVKSVEHFYQYLYGRKFLIRTDHSALKWLMQFKNPEGQIARWIERLQEYDFRIEHRAGVSHRNADSLSRRPCPVECSHCVRTEAKEPALLRTTVVNDEWAPTKIREDQENDPVLKKIRQWKEENQRPTWQEVSKLAPAIKSYWAQWDSFILEDGLLKRVFENDDGSENRKQLVIPKDKVAEVLRQLHDSPSGGHLGVKKTLQRVRERFYWMNSSDDVKDWCKKCTTCATSNGPHRKRKAPMKQYNVGSPFERIALDIAGPFPVTEKGNKYMLVVMDYFTKWVEVYAIPDQGAATVADVLIKEFICRFGVPLEIHSDQGRNFESQLFQGICDRLGMKKTRTTALHPQSDGMVERMNKTIGKYLSKVVSNHQRDWDQYLSLFAMAYRSAINESTGQTPAKILFGREMRLPCDLEFGCRPGEDVAGEDYVVQLRRRMDDMHELVRSHLQIASDRMKKRYDTQAEEGGFKEGDKVWLHNPKRQKGYSPKLQRAWEGPYLIKTRINDVIYRITKIPNGKPKVVHQNRLAPFEGDHDEENEEVNQLREKPDLEFEEFMGAYGGTGKARYGVTTERQQDLFALPEDYSLAHNTSARISDAHGLSSIFRKRFGRLTELQDQLPTPGRSLKLQDGSRYLFYLITKNVFQDHSTYHDVWEALLSLREHVLESTVQKLAMPRIECNQLKWRIIRNMVEVIFRDTGVQILVCSYPPSVQVKAKTVPCYFHATGNCKRGSSCTYKH